MTEEELKDWFWDKFNSCYLVKYDNIWSFFEANNINNVQEIRKLIKGWLEEYNKLKVLKPEYLSVATIQKLKEHDKLKIYQPQ